MRCHRLCRRQAALHSISWATRPQMECPQRHRATDRRLIIWRVTLTLRRAMASASAKMPRRLCIMGVYTSMGDWKFVDAECAPTPPMSAPAALARRFWGDASANHMPATSLRRHSPPNTMARPRTVRCAMASAAAQLPRRSCTLSGGYLNERKFRDADICRRHAALQGSSGATHPHMICPQLRNHSPPNQMARHQTLRRAMASASAKMPRRRVIWGFFGLSVGPCSDLLTTNAHTSERNLFIRSDSRNLNGDILEQPSARPQLL